MEDITNLIKESKREIQRIENEKEAFNKKYLKEKREILKIIRGDFLTGGIIASSLFIIISSLINYFSIIFPYDLLIGIFGFIVGLIILIVPMTRPKFAVRDFNKEYLSIIFDFKKNFVLSAMSVRRDIDKAYDKYDFTTEIDAESEYFKEIITFTDKIYDLGLTGLEELTRHSPRILSKKIAKINKEFIKEVELIEHYGVVRKFADIIWNNYLKITTKNKSTRLDESDTEILRKIIKLYKPKKKRRKEELNRFRKIEEFAKKVKRKNDREEQ